MGYANMDHAAWMQQHLDSLHRNSRNKANTPVKLNEFQRRVVNILGIVGGGIYNAPINADKINWTYGGVGISLIWQRELSTFDFNALTMLVFLCHEARTRCSIEAVGPRNLRLSFFQRKTGGGISEGHPDLAEAIADFNAYIAPTHHIRWLNHKPDIAETEPILAEKGE